MTLGNLIVVIAVALIVTAVALRIGGPWGMVIFVLGLLAMGISAMLWGMDSRDRDDSTSLWARRRDR